MLTPEQEKYILTHAYVPEHTVGLMTSLSGGEGYLVDDFFLCRRDDWIVFVGYPLQDDFTSDKFHTWFGLGIFLLALVLIFAVKEVLGIWDRSVDQEL
jgi:hypothetical protein